MTREHLNIPRLTASQVLMLSAIVMSMAVAGIIGAQMAPESGLATLPIAAIVVGVAIASLPAGLFMRRVGHRIGFLIGVSIGIAASLLSVYIQAFQLGAAQSVDGAAAGRGAICSVPHSQAS